MNLYTETLFSVLNMDSLYSLCIKRIVNFKLKYNSLSEDDYINVVRIIFDKVKVEINTKIEQPEEIPDSVGCYEFWIQRSTPQLLIFFDQYDFFHCSYEWIRVYIESVCTKCGRYSDKRHLIGSDSNGLTIKLGECILCSK